MNITTCATPSVLSSLKALEDKVVGSFWLQDIATCAT